MTDREMALERLRALVGFDGGSETIVFVHPGPPVPKARAKWSPRNNQWYTPTTTQVAEESLAWAWKAARVGQPPYADTVALVALFYFATVKWHKGDGDNCLKTVMDAGNRARIWKDDRQVRSFTVVMDVDARQPRTVVALTPYLSASTKAPLLLASER